MATSSPYQLWAQARAELPGKPAAVVRDRFRELMREHGHLREAKPGEDRNLPCGWPGRTTDGD